MSPVRKDPAVKSGHRVQITRLALGALSIVTQEMEAETASNRAPQTPNLQSVATTLLKTAGPPPPPPAAWATSPSFWLFVSSWLDSSSSASAVACVQLNVVRASRLPRAVSQSSRIISQQPQWIQTCHQRIHPLSSHILSKATHRQQVFRNPGMLKAILPSPSKDTSLRLSSTRLRSLASLSQFSSTSLSLRLR